MKARSELLQWNNICYLNSDSVEVDMVVTAMMTKLELEFAAGTIPDLQQHLVSSDKEIEKEYNESRAII